MRFLSSAGRFTLKVLALGLLTSVSGFAAATTIDFESPALADGVPLTITPYSSNGVTFTPSPPDPFGECFASVVGLIQCPGRPPNQALCTGQGTVSLAESRIPVKAEFAPDLVVNEVMIKVQTRRMNTVFLTLFNSAGTPVGSVSVVSDNDYQGTCLDFGATLRATALEPVAYAVIRIRPEPDISLTCTAVFMCGSCPQWAIDSFTFADALTPAREVAIDIKPGSDVNPVNCRSRNGVIPIAILTTPDFDATTVDPATISFEGANVAFVNQSSGDGQARTEDVDDDGDLDLVLGFRLDETYLTCDATDGVLRGTTIGGDRFVGKDSVRMMRGGS